MMQVRLTPEQVDQALTAFVRQLFVGQWKARVVHMHKTGGVTVEASYEGPNTVFSAPVREPVLQRELERGDLLSTQLMDASYTGAEMEELSE